MVLKLGALWQLNWVRQASFVSQETQMKVCNRNGAFFKRLQTPGSDRRTLSQATALLIFAFQFLPHAALGNGPAQATSARPHKATLQSGAPAGASASVQNRRQNEAGSSASNNSETMPLHDRQIEGLVTGGVNSSRVALLVEKRGIDFTPTVRFLQNLMAAGADDVLIHAIIKARQILAVQPTPPASLPISQAATAGDPAPKSANTGSGGAAAGGPSTAPELRQTLQQDLDRASQAERRHSWVEAERAYRDALKVDANSAAAHLGLAGVLSQERRWDEAVAEYREVLHFDPKNAQAHRALGAALAARHDLNGSIDEYREALRLNPNDAELQSQLGDALYASGDLNAATSAYRAALALKPSDASVTNSLGVALYAAGDMDGAIAAYRQAVQLDPKNAQTHNNLGDALLNKGDRRGALEEYHRAFELAPNASTLGTSYAALAKQLSSPQAGAAGKTNE